MIFIRIGPQILPASGDVDICARGRLETAANVYQPNRGLSVFWLSKRYHSRRERGNMHVGYRTWIAPSGRSRLARLERQDETPPVRWSSTTRRSTVTRPWDTIRSDPSG
jgi:hypothetical protein